MLIPGQIETWNIICDMKDISLYSAPNELKNLINIIQQNYKNRLNIMFVINLGTFAGLIWNVIKGLMGENIQNKMKLINSKNNFTELYANINKNQLEVKFGGLAGNIILTYEDNKNENNNQDINYNSNSSTNYNSVKTKNVSKKTEFITNYKFSNDFDNNFFSTNKFYFPPNMPSSEFFTEADLENIDCILMGEDEYKIKVKYDEKIIRSPFYKYDGNQDFNNFCIENNKITNLDCPVEKEKMVLNHKDSHFILNDAEEFFSARDYMNADSSSLINISIYPVIIEMRREKEISNVRKFTSYDTCNIDDLKTRTEIISFKKKAKDEVRDDKNKNDIGIDLSMNNNLNNSLKSRKNNINSKVTFYKRNKDVINNKNSTANKSKEEEIMIDDNENARKCKISCGKVKMDCSIF
jgi:hypothetical protein